MAGQNRALTGEVESRHPRVVARLRKEEVGTKEECHKMQLGTEGLVHQTVHQTQLGTEAMKTREAGREGSDPAGSSGDGRDSWTRCQPDLPA